MASTSPPELLDDPGAVGVEEQREEQVLDGHELVPPPLCLAGSQPERDLHFGADSHGSSTPARPSL